MSTDIAQTTPASPAPRGAGAFLPLLRAELSRVSHRRLFWICSSLLLAGIVVVSGIIFFNSSRPGPIPADVQRAYEQDLARQQNFYDKCVTRNVPEGEDPIQYCGEPPEEYMSVYSYTNESPYRAKEALLPVVIAISIGSAMLAFLIGASTGGAEWSSRSMTLQLLWEPRRLRLLLTKWLALAIVMTLTAVVNLAVGLGLGAATASLRGTWDGVPDGFWPELLGVAARGAVLIVFAATVAYAISMLVRNTGGSLGVGFVYFAVAELGIRLGLGKYGPDVYLLSTNVGAWLVPGGIDVPGRQTDLADGSIMIEQVHLSNLHGLVVMSGYLLVLALPALWSFRRRDVS